MGMPAARQGDPTIHGGVILTGNPAIMIGGAPAACQGDEHFCPLYDGKSPHRGGPISTASATVFIGGLAVARQGDIAICRAGPPDSIASGCPTVLIG